MKKFFTVLSVVVCLALTISACTEEEVKPIDNTTNNGGGASDRGF